ncbi:5-carboxymethyl-2-hydroxymuconate isomerase [Peribacillus butanolivorans]|uniref:5-carboxymethyl-2-hydroxymuconate Delta-isomerase n=1 Tax=Peribacillus butanolivorans TaxID=421767 RepID=UPI0006A6B138|nr:5-carboxymethyl-2-hydroxymuconate Delta-isomerase [Peribacillus butanolivorans]KON71225.1 5-carboxymethyl-2-hydroxymuconate isomerase [Peribacillus butanolivorans]
MPHVIVEYTDNIKKEADIPNLLKKVNSVLISRSDIFPTGGIRSRAIELQDYRVADGAENDAFVHTVLKIGSGRSDVDKKKICDELFEAIKGHFANLFARRYLALSMELIEFSEAGTYKHNNIHKRFRNS